MDLKWIQESECEYKLMTDFDHEIATLESWEDNVWELKSDVAHDEFLMAEDLQGAKEEALICLQNFYDSEANFCLSVVHGIEKMQSENNE